MDPFLAEFYGTGASQEEMEKTAQLEMLEKIAEEEGVDLDDLSEEELEYILSEEGEEVEEDDGDDDMEKEAMEKFAEADFLGRVMAHANWDEMQKIAAAEGSKWERAKDWAKGKGSWVKGKGRAAGGAVHGKAMGLGKRMLEGKGEGWRAKQMGRLGKRTRKVLHGAAGYGTPTAALAAAGYGGYKGYQHFKGKKKKSADEIVEQRAAEFLMEAGIDPNQVFEKTAEYTQEDIDTAALQYLEDLGVPVTWYDQE